jgi:hypothetical protein
VAGPRRKSRAGRRRSAPASAGTGALAAAPRYHPPWPSSRASRHESSDPLQGSCGRFYLAMVTAANVPLPYRPAVRGPFFRRLRGDLVRCASPSRARTNPGSLLVATAAAVPISAMQDLRITDEPPVLRLRRWQRACCPAMAASVLPGDGSERVCPGDGSECVCDPPRHHLSSGDCPHIKIVKKLG